MIVVWTDEFDRWFDHTEEQGGQLLTVAVALLQALTDLPTKPSRGVRDIQAGQASPPT